MKIPYLTDKSRVLRWYLTLSLTLGWISEPVSAKSLESMDASRAPDAKVEQSSLCCQKLSHTSEPKPRQAVPSARWVSYSLVSLSKIQGNLATGLVPDSLCTHSYPQPR